MVTNVRYVYIFARRTICTHYIFFLGGNYSVILLSWLSPFSFCEPLFWRSSFSFYLEWILECLCFHIRHSFLLFVIAFNRFHCRTNRTGCGYITPFANTDYFDCSPTHTTHFAFGFIKEFRRQLVKATCTRSGGCQSLCDRLFCKGKDILVTSSLTNSCFGTHNRNIFHSPCKKCRFL